MPTAPPPPIGVCNFCCAILSYAPVFNGWQPQVFHLIVRGLAFLSSLYWLYALGRERSRYPPVYFNLLVWSTGSFFYLLVSKLIPFTQPTVFVDAVVTVIGLAVSWWLQMQVISLMRERDTDLLSVRRSIINTTIFTTPFVLIWVVALFMQQNALKILTIANVANLPGQMVAEGLLTLVFLLIAVLPATRWAYLSPRPASQIWARFLVIVHFLLFVTACADFKASTEKATSNIAACLEVLASILYFIFFPPLFYGVLLRDCNDWRKQRALLAQERRAQHPARNRELAPQRSGVRRILLSELVLKEVVGRGQHAEVLRGIWGSTTVAVKRFRASADEDQDHLKEDLMVESKLLSELRHPNIVEFLGVVIDQSIYCIVTEFMDRGSLFNILHPPKSATRTGVSVPHWPQRLSIGRDVAAGIAFLHSLTPPVIHRDLKSHNILVNDGWKAKLGDFGVSREKYATSHMTKVGTPHWMAPEVIRSEVYSEKADVFSFGVVLWELVTGAKPYEGVAPTRVLTMVANERARPILPRDCPEIVARLMKECWMEEPSLRPSFVDIRTRMEDLTDDLPIS